MSNKVKHNKFKRNNNWDGKNAQKFQNIVKSNDNNKEVTHQRSQQKKLLTVHDTKPFVLQHRALGIALNVEQSILQVSQDYGVSKFIDALGKHFLATKGPIGGEVKGVQYQPLYPLPEMPELTGPGINADMKKILISQHGSDREAHLREKVQNQKERVMIISETLSLLSEPIKLVVEAKFPNYINAPDVIAVMDCIKSTYALSQFAGHQHELYEQVNDAQAAFRNGTYAFKNQMKNGLFDIDEHKKMCMKLFDYMNAAEFPDMAEIDKAKFYIVSFKTIDKYKEYVKHILDNESKFSKMPRATLEQRTRADAFRELPKTFEEAHMEMQALIDPEIVYKTSTNVIPPTMMQQKASQVTNKGEKSKRKANSSDSKNEKPVKNNTSDSTPKRYCELCQQNGHTVDKCFKLKEYAKVIENYGNKGPQTRGASKGDKKVEEIPKQSRTQSSTVIQQLDSDEDDYEVYHPGKVRRSYQNSSKVIIRMDDLDFNDEFLAQYDNGACINSTEIKSRSLVTKRTQETVNMHIQTTNGIRYLDDAWFGVCRGLGKTLYTPTAHMNLISAALIERLYPVEISRNNNITMSYTVLLEPYNSVLQFNRTDNGIYVGSLKPLMDLPKHFIPRPRFFPIMSPDDFKHQCSSHSTATNNHNLSKLDELPLENIEIFTNTLNKQEEALAESSIGDVSKSKEDKMFEFALTVVQPNLMSIAPSAYAKMVHNAGIINAPVPPNTLIKAVEKLGVNREYLVGKHKAQKKKKHLKVYIDALQEGEILIEMDLVFVEELVFLMGVGYPGFYGVLSYIGYGTGCKHHTAILPHLHYLFSVYKAMKHNIKFVSADGEKGFKALTTEINEMAGLFIPLPKNDHPCFVDLRVKFLKELMRCTCASVDHLLPRKLIQSVANAAIYFMNHTPCKANPSEESPMMFAFGIPLDWKQHHNIRPLMLCEIPIEDKMKSNTMAQRTITAIAAYPLIPQGYMFVNVLTNQFMASSVYEPRRSHPAVSKNLHERRLKELDVLHLKPDTSSIVKVQAKKIVDFRSRQFMFNVKKHGLLNIALAMKDELSGIVIDKKVFYPVHEADISKDDMKKLLTTGALFDTKVKEGKEILKNRFIVKGNKQDSSQFDKYTELYSPTVQESTVNQLLVTAAEKGLAIVTSDFKQAFLDADQDRVQYAKIDKWVSAFLVILWPELFKDYLRKDGTILVYLMKALYGQRQAPKLFNDHLLKILNEMEYIQNPIDQGLFSKDLAQLGPADMYAKLEVATHVDDIFAIVPVQYVQTYITNLKHKFGDNLTISSNVNSEGTLDGTIPLEYLGKTITMNYDEHYAIISPIKYFKKLCDLNQDLLQGTVRKVPAKADFYHINPQSIPLLGDIKARFERIIYQIRYSCSIAIELLHYASHFVSRIKDGITEQDSDNIIYMLQYINGRQDLALQIGTNQDNKQEFIVFSDASHGPKSYTAGVYTTGRGALYVNHHKQNLVSIASAHAELYAASDNMVHGLAIQNVMESRGLPVEDYRPGVFYVDNMAVIHMMKNGRSVNSKSKHIHIRYFFMKQNFDTGDFTLVHCPTDLMVADILTKPLQGEQFLKLRSKLLGYEYMK